MNRYNVHWAVWVWATLVAACAGPNAGTVADAGVGAGPVAVAVTDAGAGAVADAGAVAGVDAGSTLDAGIAAGPANTVYVSFILNVHDWVFPENSIATLNKIIDLHEQYRQPVDIYLTDAVVQIYAAEAPALINRLKTSPYVSISLHVRPPVPYYWGFDWAGLSALSGDALSAKLLAYEERKVDLVTGETTADEGGYEYMKKLFGYPPYVVGLSAGANPVEQALAAIYKAKGAKFTLVHNDVGTAWGVVRNGLFMRPETAEVKVYERKTEVDFATEILAPAMTTVGAARPAFVNLKWHEDNFYTSGTPWQNVYYNVRHANGQRILEPKPLPWDTTAYEPVTRKTAAEKAIQWRRYETALQTIIAHPETYTIVGIRDLARMAGLE